ncbi:hypothetical protein [Robiginitalea sp. SC105]|uniref:hypothetical protein n=1 Tax=Robiginitalea sp. SC105 TaxID=2762332 RepID=UPI00163964DE|nr:hypothetical protein [Robiginitalea sp. SC105]MBC2840086.1 hypothetical protein [Robiginitalea sp. SC105]
MEQQPTSAMLRLFRQIRRRLLSGNKFSKYLLYAVGEILLVVIGILIALQLDDLNEKRNTDEQETKLLLALQVNNWNEDRQRKVQEREILNGIKN